MPMNIWPSAPMFQKFDLKETVSPTAASPIGTDLRTAAVRSSLVVKTERTWTSTLTASIPSSCIIEAEKRSARSRNVTVMVAETDAGTSSLLSTLIGRRSATSIQFTCFEKYLTLLGLLRLVARTPRDQFPDRTSGEEKHQA